MTSGHELISWRVSPPFDRSHSSAESTFFTGRKEECFSYRFQGPRGHETHSAHKWLCKASAQARKRKTLKLLRWEGGFPLWLEQSPAFSSLPAALGPRQKHRCQLSQQTSCSLKEETKQTCWDRIIETVQVFNNQYSLASIWYLQGTYLTGRLGCIIPSTCRDWDILYLVPVETRMYC